ncbi:unnamed protein product [Leptidea sinapis]|uniref:C2H2-type domain-containing protein n=1 Tax=Leptidea sinapis TaxID=189913 RepID=A0A5E4QZK7_9NEOP|nr:unnamed protein product [Leptidea sinapis]
MVCLYSQFEITKEAEQSDDDIVLTREEQLQEMERRSRSLNYLNSPYKCGLCYRGFVDPQAYSNHEGRHSECDVCRLRYGSARLLRAHAQAAHVRRYRCPRRKSIDSGTTVGPTRVTFVDRPSLRRQLRGHSGTQDAPRPE